MFIHLSMARNRLGLARGGLGLKIMLPAVPDELAPHLAKLFDKIPSLHATSS